MHIAPDTVLLSRWQFALTALFHFCFVPLTLGLSVLLGIMETVYVMTGQAIWKQMTRYWGLLFGINFAMGVATGVTMEFQFGTNWAYYSQYIGDIFGAPLAIEGMMAFFLEATFVGLFFFGWSRLSKLQHLAVTWLVALGSSLSALWILIANAWMQHPVGSYFDFHTMRMEVKDFGAVIFNPVAQAKFVHTISAGYVTGAIFVLSISCYFLIRKRNIPFAKRSFAVAASFGLAAALSVVVLGDESGYLANHDQKMKIAAIESMWHTEPAPASFTLFGIPSDKDHTTKYAIDIPYMLGIIATRSFHEPLLGIVDLVNEAEQTYIPKGLDAYRALNILQKDPNNLSQQRILDDNSRYLGYALLLKQYREDPLLATPEDIHKAAWSTVPGHIGSLFWSFRGMVACGFYFILLFSMAFYWSAKRFHPRWFLWMALCSLPLPWISSELGWYIAEHGRQPWVVEGLLPTFLGTSSVTVKDVTISLIGFIAFYTTLAIIELKLMVKYIRKGPDGLGLLTHTGGEQ